MKYLGSFILAVSLTACGGDKEEKGETEDERRSKELEHARLMAEVEFEKEQRLAELRAAADREKEEAAVAAQRAFDNTLVGQKVQVVKKLYFKNRNSWMNESDIVLIIVNPSSVSADIQLKCETGGGYKKTLNVSIPANGREEIGSLEGWSFSTGDSFKVLFRGITYHSQIFK